MEKREDLFQQMDAVLREREELYQKREAEMKECREELRQLEAELARQKEALEQEKEQLQTEKESLARERVELEQAKKELVECQEAIFQEKLKLQTLKNENLKLQSEQEEAWINQVREQLGSAAAPEQMADETENTPEEIQEEESESPQLLEQIEPETEQTGQMNREDPDSETAPEQPEESLSLIETFEQKAKELFPEGTVLETTKEMLCMQIAEKELQIRLENPPQAVILARREKSRELLRGIKDLKRLQAEWVFTYQDNRLCAAMPFTQAVPPDAVLEKCADAIQRYFL